MLYHGDGVDQDRVLGNRLLEEAKSLIDEDLDRKLPKNVINLRRKG